MAEEIYGSMGSSDFENIRKRSQELMDIAADQKRAVKGLSDSLADLLQSQVNQARSLSKITDDTLKKKGSLASMEKQLLAAEETRKGLATAVAERTKTIDKQQEAILKKEQALATLKTSNNKSDQSKVASLEKEIAGRKETLRNGQKQLDIARSAAEAQKQQVVTLEDIIRQQKILASQTAFFDKMLEVVQSIPGLGPAISGPFQKAATAAAKVANEGKGLAATYRAGFSTLGKEILALAGPLAMLKAGFDVSKQAGELNRQLGIGQEASRGVRDNFGRIADNSGSAVITTGNLLKATTALNQAFGTSVTYSDAVTQNFVKQTELMGVSNEAAAKMGMLQEITGGEASDFSKSLAESVYHAGKGLGVHISTGQAFEKIKNLSTQNLINLKNSPQAIGEALALSEKLGMSFQQLNQASQSLLNFEQSISNELEAEILTGRQLNLERARAAALTGDDVALMRELGNQIGTLTQFQSMNVIQREALAQAFGMSSDAMGEMLLKQELINKLGERAKDLTAEQAAQIKKMVKDGDATSEGDALEKLQQQEDAAKKFELAVSKLKDVFTNMMSVLAGPLEMMGDFLKTFASSGIGKFALMGASIGSLALLARKMMAGATPFTPMYVRDVGIAGNMSGSSLTSRIPGASRYQAAMRMNQAGKLGMSRSMGMGAGLGFAAGGALVQYAGNSLAEGFEESGNMAAAQTTDVVSGAGQGALYGAALGSVVPVIGTAAGAIIGGAIGLIAGGVEAANRRAEAEANEKKDKDARFNNALDKLAEAQARDIILKLDGVKVGEGLNNAATY